MKNTRISEVMSTNLIQVSTEDTVDVIADIFQNEAVHHILVNDRSDSFCGIVSKSDFDKISLGMSILNVQKRAEYNEALYRSLRVLDIMTPEPVCLSPNDTLDKAAALFLQNQFRALPIKEQEQLVGIITPNDLVRHCLA